MRQNWGSRPTTSTIQPTTMAILVLVVAGFLAIWVRPDIMAGFALLPESLTNRPWSVITHPFANGSFIAVIFSGLWLYQVGMIIEREVGSVRLAIASAVFVLLTSAMAILAWSILGPSGVVFGIYPYLAALTIAWGTRNPEAEIRIWGVIPIKLKWLAWVSAGVVFFGAPPSLAPFIAAPLALVWLVADDKTPIPYSGFALAKKRQKKKDDAKVISFMDEVKKRESRRKEDEDLRKLFEGSNNEDR